MLINDWKSKEEVARTPKKNKVNTPHIKMLFPLSDDIKNQILTYFYY